MNQIEHLREQAAVLRSLAGSFDMPSIKADLMNLANRCEQMAARLREANDRAAEPITDEIGAT